MTVIPSFQTTDQPSSIANGLYVSERYFRVASFADLAPGKQPQLVTDGLIQCTAVTLHHRRREMGLLAHIGYTRSLTKALNRISSALFLSVSELDVRVIAAEQESDGSGENGWPSAGMVVDYFESLGVASLALDNNVGNLSPRGVALNLESGIVSEVLYDPYRWYVQNDPDWRSQQQPIEQ